MAVKLTDKEITALAKKVQAKNAASIKKDQAVVIKAKIADAKKVVSILNTLPPEIYEWLYSSRYDAKRANLEDIAKVLAGSDLPKIKDYSAYEPDVILAAHDCTSMTALCKKLGI